MNGLTALMLEPLPSKAFKRLPGAAKLTAISADYTRERLTEVFGVAGIGWGLEFDPHFLKTWATQEKSSGGREYELFHAAIEAATFWFVWGGERHEIPVTGYASNSDYGYALAGARTSAIGSGAKELLFQLHIYKNEAAPKTSVGTISGKQHSSLTAEKIFNTIQERTGAYYKHMKHLINAVGELPDLSDRDAVKEYGTRAIEHAAQKASEGIEQDTMFDELKSGGAAYED